MGNLIIKTKPDTPFLPNVTFNASTGICILEGESFMDNTHEFYAPLIDWLKSYCMFSSNQVSFKVRLSYFNTSTSRMLLEMLEIIAGFIDNGGKAEITWHCFNDTDMRDEVEDFEEETGLVIHIEDGD